MKEIPYHNSVVTVRFCVYECWNLNTSSERRFSAILHILGADDHKSECGVKEVQEWTPRGTALLALHSSDATP